jgi:chromosome partitioning protein
LAKKVAIVNMKGGVGKSTLTAQFAYEFAILKKWAKKVLVVDLDPQFNVSQYLLGPAKYEKEVIDKNVPTTWHIFEQHTRIPGQPIPEPLVPKDVIFSVAKYSASLVDLVPSRLELAFSLRNTSQKEELLAKFVSAIEKDYDLILIDCPPTESLFALAAYHASDMLLVPVKPEFLSAIGLPLLQNSLDEFGSQNGGKAPKVAGVVFNFASNYAPEELKSKKEVTAVANKFGWYLFEREVPYSRSIAKSAREGKPLRWTSWSHQTQVDKLTRVAEEFATRVGI